jgi:glycogen synthase
MLGWEFPPYKSGGLGTACYDLTKGLAREGVEITFVMPCAPSEAYEEFVDIIGANTRAKIRTVHSLLTPYMTTETYDNVYSSEKCGDLYGPNMHVEIERFSRAVENIIKDEEFDIIHAHDWMTYAAGVLAKEHSGKPLIVHLHATEGDRTSGHANQEIVAREQLGFLRADKIITNSWWSKKNIINEYSSIPQNNIEVVHWGITQDNPAYDLCYRSSLNKTDKIVLFLGRITIQKGIWFLVHAARDVVKHVPNAKFVIVGRGDQFDEIVSLVSDAGLSDNFLFTGWLQGVDVHKAFQMADVFVMPSVSEPFGLVALEALKNNTPIIVSKQSGVSEIVHNALTVDFWDTRDMANKIINVLQYDSLREVLQEESAEEARSFDLQTPARKCIAVYNEVLSRGGIS